MELLFDKTFATVLLGQDLLEFAWDQSTHTLEFRDTQWPEITALVAVVICTAPNSGLGVWLALLEDCEIDVHASLHVDPAGIDDVHPIDLGVVVVRVDIEEIFGLHDLVVLAVLVGNSIVPGVFCAIPIVAHVLHRIRGNLNVEIEIPRHNPAVPPPAQQRAVSDPCLVALLFEEVKV